MVYENKDFSGNTYTPSDHDRSLARESSQHLARLVGQHDLRLAVAVEVPTDRHV